MYFKNVNQMFEKSLFFQAKTCETCKLALHKQTNIISKHYFKHTYNNIQNQRNRKQNKRLETMYTQGKNRNNFFKNLKKKSKTYLKCICWC